MQLFSFLYIFVIIMGSSRSLLAVAQQVVRLESQGYRRMMQMACPCSIIVVTSDMQIRCRYTLIHRTTRPSCVLFFFSLRLWNQLRPFCPVTFRPFRSSEKNTSSVCFTIRPLVCLFGMRYHDIRESPDASHFLFGYLYKYEPSDPPEKYWIHPLI